MYMRGTLCLCPARLMDKLPTLRLILANTYTNLQIHKHKQ